MKKFSKGLLISVIVCSGVLGFNYKKVQSTIENKDHILDVPYIHQFPDYPTGCESVSACMLLQYFDFDITVNEFIDYHLPMGLSPYVVENGFEGNNPNDYFLGNPYKTSGFGCYAPVIAKALEEIVDEQWEVKTLYDETLDDLCHTYIDHDYPVLLWASMYMENPSVGVTYQDIVSKEMIDWKQPMHCLVLVGYDEENYYFNDPMTKQKEVYPKEAVENAYLKMGSQAVVMVKTLDED